MFKSTVNLLLKGTVNVPIVNKPYRGDECEVGPSEMEVRRSGGNFRKSPPPTAKAIGGGKYRMGRKNGKIGEEKNGRKIEIKGK